MCPCQFCNLAVICTRNFFPCLGSIYATVLKMGEGSHMKNVSFTQFLDSLQIRRQARELVVIPLQGVTFLHDLTSDPNQTLDMLEEVSREFQIPITRTAIQDHYLSPYLRYNLQDLYDAFTHLEEEAKFQRNRKIWYGIGFLMMGLTIYELFVDLRVIQSILLAFITSGIFQYLYNSNS